MKVEDPGDPSIQMFFFHVRRAAEGINFGGYFFIQRGRSPCERENQLEIKGKINTWFGA